MNGYLQASPVDTFSVYSHTRTNSSDASAPITPISLSLEGPADLQYPDAVSSAYDHAFGHFGSAAPDQPFGGDYGFSHDAYRPKSAQEYPLEVWDVAAMHGHSSQDGTPRG